MLEVRLKMLDAIGEEVFLAKEDYHSRKASTLNRYLVTQGFDLDKPYSCRRDDVTEELVYEQDENAEKHIHLRPEDQ